MLGNRIKPVIGKFIGTSVSGTGAKLVDSVSSSKSPLEPNNTQSPRALKNYDLGGVGLGIVVALEKSGHFRQEIKANKTFNSMNSTRSKPIPVNSSHNSKRIREKCVDEMEIESLEGYTFVSFHGRNSRRRSIKSTNSNNQAATIFDLSTPKIEDFTATYPALSYCHLCHKKLHGEDIYMYRGEKGFCSSDCRSIQILMDERKEKCGSEAASRSIDAVSNGIFAI